MGPCRLKRVAVHALDGIAALVHEEAPLPEPGPGEVRLKVGAAGLGFVDGLLIAGKYQWKPPLPFVPGGEIAGTVDAVGEGVAGWTRGQPVAAWLMGGGLAEFCVLPASSLVAVPESVATQAAAAVLLDYATADYALNLRGVLRAGETVFVLGANGGVGGAAMAIAKADGAKVVAGVSSPARRDAAMARGASATVDLSQANWREELRAVLAGGAPDIVVDPLGGDLTEPAFRSLAKGGRLCCGADTCAAGQSRAAQECGAGRCGCPSLCRAGHRDLHCAPCLLAAACCARRCSGTAGHAFSAGPGAGRLRRAGAARAQRQGDRGARRYLTG